MRSLGAFLTFLSGTASVLALVACGSDSNGRTPTVREPKPPGPATVSVAVSFPNDAVKGVTDTVHVWVVGPGDSSITCADLVGGAVDPYSGRLELFGDTVSKDLGSATAKNVDTGNALVYVEAVDYSGHVDYAGCQAVDVKQPTTSVSVTLGRARVYDCATAKDGLPCDDGQLCTVGETCKNNQCQGGKQRECTNLTDSCNAGSCTEDKGCTAKPLPDGTACDDNLYCTTGDSCHAGKCTGTTLDCAAQAGPCRTSLGCSELYQGCQFTTDSTTNGTPCDDGQFCTTNDTCYYGQCQGQARDCSAGLDSYCASAACDETTKSCVVTPASSGTYCYTSGSCTSSSGSCDGAGHCVGTPLDCSGYTYGCYVGQCSPAYGYCQSVPANAGTPCVYGGTCATSPQCDGAGTCLCP
jgi:hypothetical protein